MKRHSSFFPRLESLADFQQLAATPLSQELIPTLLHHPQLFKCPKNNDQISRQHSHLLDKILGLQLKQVEEKLVREAAKRHPQGDHSSWGPSLHHGVQTWVGLDPQTLNTPYSVLLRLCELLEIADNQTVIDLGAAQGRLGIVMAHYNPKAKFIGYEYVKERVEEGNKLFARWDCRQAKLIQQDLFASNFELPAADIYFIYDYGQHKHIAKTLRQIEPIAQNKAIRLVARGKVTNRIIQDEHPWAQCFYEGYGDEHFSIYQASLSNALEYQEGLQPLTL